MRIFNFWNSENSKNWTFKKKFLENFWYESLFLSSLVEIYLIIIIIYLQWQYNFETTININVKKSGFFICLIFLFYIFWLLITFASTILVQITKNLILPNSLQTPCFFFFSLFLIHFVVFVWFLSERRRFAPIRAADPWWLTVCCWFLGWCLLCFWFAGACGEAINKQKDRHYFKDVCVR